MSDQASALDAPTDKIRFVLDGEVAEGDCGACTVVLAELNRDGDDISLRAINSCIQFLPTLDGKELITVESLDAGGELHPVQQAMVDCHASQCGFCTPGFVMSLFALYKTNAKPTRREIDDALAGNLCRCTGYRPIIEAAQSLQNVTPGDDWLRQPFGNQVVPVERVEQLRGLRREQGLRLSAQGKSFFAPTSIGELAEILAAHPDATILAGGTDIGLWVTKQHRELSTVVYTGRVDGLDVLDVSATHIEIGAAVTLSNAMAVIVELYPDLDELFRRFASPPIRNAGTLGGNIANGSPIGDSMPALMVVGTSLVLRLGEDTREIQLDDFYIDYQVNELRPGEFIERIRIPLPEDGVVEDDSVASFRMACGGMAATIRRAFQCEAEIEGQVWNEETIGNATDALKKDFAPISDMRASADYRLQALQNLLQRFYLESRGEITETVYSYGRRD